MSVLTQPRQVQLEQPATVILLPSKHEALELISAAGAEKYLDKMAEIDAQIAKLNAVIQAQTANLRAEIDKLAERLVPMLQRGNANRVAPATIDLTVSSSVVIKFILCNEFNGTVHFGYSCRGSDSVGITTREHGNETQRDSTRLTRLTRLIFKIFCCKISRLVTILCATCNHFEPSRFSSA